MRRFAAGVGGDLTPIFFASARPSFLTASSRVSLPLLLPSHLVRFRVSVHVPHPRRVRPRRAHLLQRGEQVLFLETQHVHGEARRQSRAVAPDQIRQARLHLRIVRLSAPRRSEKRVHAVERVAELRAAHRAKPRDFPGASGDHAGRRTLVGGTRRASSARDVAAETFAVSSRESNGDRAMSLSSLSRLRDLAATLSISAVSSAESYASNVSS